MRRNIGLWLVFLLILSLLLVACGDDTAVPASSTTPQGTASGTRTAGAVGGGTGANPPPAGGSNGGGAGTVTAVNGSPLSKTTAASGAVSVPTYPGATRLNSLAGASGAVETYKTTDTPDKVKAFYGDFFSKDSWQVQTNLNNPYASVLGNAATVLSYTKNGQTAVVIVTSAADAAKIGITGTNSSDTIILIAQTKV